MVIFWEFHKSLPKDLQDILLTDIYRHKLIKVPVLHVNLSISVCCGGIWSVGGHIKPGEKPEDRGRKVCQSGKIVFTLYDYNFFMNWCKLSFPGCHLVQSLPSRCWLSKRSWRDRVKSWCRPARQVKLHWKPWVRWQIWPVSWRLRGWSTRTRSVCAALTRTEWRSSGPWRPISCHLSCWSLNWDNFMVKKDWVTADFNQTLKITLISCDIAGCDAQSIFWGWLSDTNTFILGLFSLIPDRLSSICFCVDESMGCWCKIKNYTFKHTNTFSLFRSFSECKIQV